MAVFFAQVADAGTAGFEGPQAEQPQQRDQGEVVGLDDCRAVVIKASNCRFGLVRSGLSIKRPRSHRGAESPRRA
ncbi:hypothetical protein [Paractinoplanes rishiriensis]|uniref:hypothetical protein n=1 Tax=Paractinoplanes rishiriensis TaxID=1050105 RepID=UPI00194209EF|nr:hypothetical protein [Actinoplanes rishiriensis]